ncbi:epoxide hydrolase N-terminal domain-containing protein [Streptomyces sp. NPDC059874]|uniref:epoxide hydrolase N-terminal domain-containing protein n=1 Tax=Streptomyces sp. NPDC059874 TaxID=3346983 RepID=UPI003659ED94
MAGVVVWWVRDWGFAPGLAPQAPAGLGWDYGVPVGEMRELVRYWRDEYDWRAAEERLNEWPQFVTVVDGARVHFAHVRSPEPGATPLLMTHGWPGSIVEFQKVAGALRILAMRFIW